MSAMSINGSAIIAMTGKNCAAICSDLRFGISQQTLGTDMKKIFRVHDRLYLGLTGLATDIQTLHHKFAFQHNLFKLREERDMEPATFSAVVSNALYAKRFGPFYCEPVIAGLDSASVPYINAMDLLGAQARSYDFVVSGTATESLLGACESLYRPDMGPEDLFETIAQALLAAVNRDCLSGWGGIVYVITPEGTTVRHIKGRMD